MNYKLPADLVHLKRASRHLFFRPDTLAWIITDDMGAFVLKALADRRDVKEIGASIAAELGFPLEEVVSEMQRFLEALQKEGIVETATKIAPKRAVCSAKAKPGSLYLHLTARCNLSCSYCYNRTLRSRKRMETDLPLPIAVQTLHQAKELGVSTVILTGGEPLLHPRVVEIAKAAQELGFRTALLTNGLPVDAPLARELARFCDQITVSLDSADPTLHDLHRGPGTHKRVVEAIRCLKEAGIKEVVVSGVITRHNQHEPRRAFEKFANEIGADRAAREIYIPQGDERDLFLVPDFDALLQDMEEALEKAIAEGFEAESEAKVVWRDRCGAAYGVIAVDHDGSVYPCQGLMMPELNAGNIAENSLGKIYEESETLAQVRGITVADIPGCRDCDFRHLCGGGCRALAYNIHCSLAAPIPEEYCAFNRLLAEGKLWAAALST